MFGAASGCAPGWLDALLMRLTEILLSVPSLLLIVLLQAALGEATVPRGEGRFLPGKAYCPR